MIAPVHEVAGALRLPRAFPYARVTERSDFDRIAAVQPDIWQDDDEPTWLAESLEAEKRADPHYLTVVVAEADRAVVCAGLGAVRARNGLRDVPGRRNGAGVARARDLPSNGRVPGNLAAERGFPLHRGRRLQRQPPHPRASRIRRRDDDNAVRLVATGRSGRLSPWGGGARRKSGR